MHQKLDCIHKLILSRPLNSHEAQTEFSKKGAQTTCQEAELTLQALGSQFLHQWDPTLCMHCILRGRTELTITGPRQTHTSGSLPPNVNYKPLINGEKGKKYTSVLLSPIHIPAVSSYPSLFTYCCLRRKWFLYPVLSSAIPNRAKEKVNLSCVQGLSLPTPPLVQICV